MNMNDDYYIELLEKDILLYKIFMFIGDYNVTFHIGAGYYVQPNSINIDELIKDIQARVENKSNEIIKAYIETLISYKLLKFDNDNPDKIRMTNQFDSLEIQGDSVYVKIKTKKDEEIEDKKLEEEFISSLNDLTEPYEKKLEDLDKKIDEMKRTVDSGIIKNVQVISIFAGIISLLFANIMGIKDFATIGVYGLSIINFCMVLSIFALILFTKLLIIGDKIKKSSIIICIVMLVLLAVPIILFAFKIVKCSG